ncbi:MAG: mercuric reductase [Synechococcales cyanobacterium]
MAYDYDVVVIGGGSAGLVVTSAAAQLGAKVLLVEKHRLGGDCLWYGCVPSKSLIHQSREVYAVRRAIQQGVVTAPTWHVNYQKVHDHVKAVQGHIAEHDAIERFEALGATVTIGTGAFRDPQTFVVDQRPITARAFVIATGSRPQIPPIPGLAEAGFLTNEQVFDLTQAPKRLAVIGAGPIGCELGQALARLGSQVTLIASRSQILPKEEPEAAAVVAEQMQQDGVNILLNSRVAEVRRNGQIKELRLGERWLPVDEILLATGRLPNVEQLNLEAARVRYTADGVGVNAKLQTSNPRIYACGDVIGGHLFTHVAGYEAAVALVNGLFFPVSKANYRVIPWVTFTDPEVARVGLSEAEAMARYGQSKVRVLKHAFAGVDRAQAEDATRGFAKILCLAKGEILGATLVGSQAGELLAEIVLAMNYQLPVSALTGIHAYPTLSEVNSKAALQLKKQTFAQNPWQKALLTRLFAFWRGA